MNASRDGLRRALLGQSESAPSSRDENPIKAADLTSLGGGRVHLPNMNGFGLLLWYVVRLMMAWELAGACHAKVREARIATASQGSATSARGGCVRY